jgi:hypothetical protein
MVRAILEGRKTMTRRAVKPQPTLDHGLVFEGIALGKFGAVSDSEITCPYGTIGDRLWVRETWAPHPQDPTTIFYRATVDTEPGICVWDGPWKPSIYMPRWANRITLEITAIRVEPLQNISEEDARAEGCRSADYATGRECILDEKAGSYRLHFQSLWDSINAKRHPWASNPWVWVVEFRRAE